MPGLKTPCKSVLHCRYLSAEPHIAGRDVDEVKLVDYITGLWNEFGFDVEVHPYDVLLSYPNQEDSNLISIVLENGKSFIYAILTFILLPINAYTIISAYA